jgi:hypothetical protein
VAIVKEVFVVKKDSREVFHVNFFFFVECVILFKGNTETPIMTI